MINIQLLIAFLLFNCFQIRAQNTILLKSVIEQYISTKNAIVGVSVSGNNESDTFSINGDQHFPLQSVFKFHIALALLSKIDEGKFSLTQKITIRKMDLLPNLYSPIREKYPNGTTLTIAEILKYTVSESDNVGCDILLQLIGGPRVVNDFFIKRNVKNISIKINEQTMQANWDEQFRNWTTPKAANEVLKIFYINKPKILSQASYDFIWATMKGTTTGVDRLKGLLPKTVTIAHKTGTSGTNKQGIAAAVNDIGIIFLPDGRYFFISVFVTNSKEDDATNDAIIAGISSKCYDYFLKNNK